MSDKEHTHTVELTHDEWMKALEAMGDSVRMERARGDDWNAKKINEVRGEVLDALKDD